MKKEKSFRGIRETVGAVLGCAAELIVGILLLAGPVHFTTWIIMGVGVLLIVLGAMDVLRYFRMKPEQAAEEQNLAKGLLELLIGAFCALKSGWFVMTFPLLTVLYGVGVLMLAIVKVQLAVDRLRLKEEWIMSAVSAALALLFALVILLNPFATTKAMWMFIGIGLIVEAVVDALPLAQRWKKGA